MTSTDSPPQPPDAAPRLPLNKIVKITNSRVRLRIMRELVRHRQSMGPIDIGRVVGITKGAAQKHLADMRDLGVLVQGFGRLYALDPRWMPPPGSMQVDFGFCLLRLDAKWD